MSTMNKWEVTTDPLTLRRLGKLGEELGELGNVASRIIIQGIDAIDPGTGKLNRQRLADELADVQAQIDCTLIAFGLSDDYHHTRASRKRGQMAEWEALYAPVPGVAALAPAQEWKPCSSCHSHDNCRASGCAEVDLEVSLRVWGDAGVGASGQQTVSQKHQGVER